MSIHLGLERVRRLATHLDPFKRPTIHVAGTNGKGSVTNLIASILRASGLSIGTFNSPHLVSVHDAVLINGKPVSPSLYDHARSLVVAADHHLETAATPFELLTLTALQIFEDAKLDIVVIEVGMGGQDDATNVLPDDCILVSVLTSVDLDHQKFLGDTIESITEHKARIARSGKPFVLGPQKYPIVEAAARHIVESPGIRGHFIISTPVRPLQQGEEYHFSPSERPFAPPPGRLIEFDSTQFTSPIHARLPLHGTHQLDNLSLSLAVISTLLTHTSPRPALDYLSHRITSESVRAGIEGVSWPGRLTFHTLPRPVTVGSTLDPSVVLVDGAHNAASAETLASYISELVAQLKPKSRLHITYIVALSHSPPKTPFDTLSRILLPHGSEGSIASVRVAALRFTSPEGMPWVTCVSPLEIRDTVQQVIPLGDEDVWTASDDLPVDSQLSRAFEWTEAGQVARAEECLVVVTGSLYLVADFYRLLRLLEE
ncbi:Mur ligase [Boletus edulis BED1]|uniref:Mur ligase n=1 Tax=Boletus edulis BED1 TaxID=1328754 RepID=A0AAD4BXJ6_BOLED|nr:Mur ligase [Boletus edulis BED1]